MSMNWYLRKSDSTVYGPVEESILTSWAASGRIMPDDQVSPDRKTWQPAPSLTSLHMEWMLELGDGERFGPLHVLALAELVRDETVLPGQPVTNTVHLNSCSLGEAVLPAMLALAPPVPPEDPELPRLREALAKAETRIRELEARPAPTPPPTDPELPRLRETLGKAEARIRELEARPLPAPPTPAPESPELPRLREALAKAEARIREIEARPAPTLPPPDPELPRLREALGKAEARIRKLESIPPPPPAPPEKAPADGPSSDFDIQLQSYRTLAHNYDRLLEQLNGKAAEFAHVLEMHATAKTDLENQLAQARVLALHAQNDAESARQNMLKGEQAHLAVIKSYRDLNDRYIRLRQEYAAAKPAPVAPKPSDKPSVRLV